jgi:hypothetical protein
VQSGDRGKPNRGKIIGTGIKPSNAGLMPG